MRTQELCKEVRWSRAMAWPREGGGVRETTSTAQRACALSAGTQLRDLGLLPSPETCAGSGLVSSAGEGSRAERQGQVCVAPATRVPAPSIL